MRLVHVAVSDAVRYPPTVWIRSFLASLRRKIHPLTRTLADRHVVRLWFVLLTLGLGTSNVQGQWNSTPDARIRERAEAILSRNEFRYVNRLGTKVDQGLGNDEVGDGDWQPGEDAGAEGEEQAGQRDWQKQADRWNQEDRQEDRIPGSESQVGVSNLFGTLYTALAWGFVAIVVAAIVFLIVRTVASWESDASADTANLESNQFAGELEIEAPPGAIPADVYLDRALKLAASGQFREAVAQLLMGSMSHIERSGLLRFRQGLTLRDYLRSIRQLPDAHEGLKAMIRVYEPVGFGRREATRRHFELTLAGYKQGFSHALAVQNS